MGIWDFNISIININLSINRKCAANAVKKQTFSLTDFISANDTIC